MANKPNLDNYNEVSERMLEFFAKYPEGSLQQVNVNLVKVAEQDYVIYTAAAKRHPGDTDPGHGTAWEIVPGKTTFTKDSELQNAETSAWGRAILAVGASDTKKGIASREEVRNRAAEEPYLTRPKVNNEEGRAALRALCEERGLKPETMADLFHERFGVHPRVGSNEDLKAFVEIVRQGLVEAASA